MRSDDKPVKIAQKKIAAFMGGEVIMDEGVISSLPGAEKVKVWKIPNIGGYQFSLRYATSWDWLMPVFDKIANMGFHYTIKPGTIAIYKTKLKEEIALRKQFVPEEGEPVADPNLIAYETSEVNATMVINDFLDRYKS